MNYLKRWIICHMVSQRFFVQFEKKDKRYIKENIDGGYIFICSYDANITNKILRHYYDATLTLYGIFLEASYKAESRLSNEIRRYKHNITSYNLSIFEEVDSLVNVYEKDNDWRTIVQHVEDNITHNIRETALVLLKVQKKSKLIKHEIIVNDYMHSDNIQLSKDAHNIHKIIKLSVQPYYLDFVNLGLTLDIDNSYDEVYIDYPSIAVLLGHIWDNTVKYIYPKSTLRISFTTNNQFVIAEIKMLSLKMESDEIENIFKEGFSGYWAKKSSRNGHGIGMFYVKELARKNGGGDFEIHKGHTVTKDNNDTPYSYNSFILKLPKYAL